MSYNSPPATTTSYGVVQIGDGLTINPSGLLCVVGSNNGTFTGNVVLTNVNYTAISSDFFIGATARSITITLPLGVIGKVYVIKNQTNGSITVQGTASQPIDALSEKVIGAEASITVIFDGTRWNII